MSNQRTSPESAAKTIRLEVSHQSHIQLFACVAMTLKDEVLILCTPDDHYAIHVYDRNNLTQLKGVIPLREINLRDFASCGFSNCLYILNNERRNLSVLRITKTNDHQFDISPFISELRRRNDAISVACNGNLVLSWQKASEKRAVFSVYSPKGESLYETWLTGDICRLFYKVIPKSEGGVVLVSSDDKMKTKLTEVDTFGGIQREYQSSLFACHNVCQADATGRILIAESLNNIELLDPDFSVVKFTGPQLDMEQLRYCGRMSYSSDRNEVVTFVEDEVLTIFRFTEV